jgi:hypothetical protein
MEDTESSHRVHIWKLQQQQQQRSLRCCRGYSIALFQDLAYFFTWAPLVQCWSDGATFTLGPAERSADRARGSRCNLHDRCCHRAGVHAVAPPGPRSAATSCAGLERVGVCVVVTLGTRQRRAGPLLWASTPPIVSAWRSLASSWLASGSCCSSIQAIRHARGARRWCGGE